MWAALEHGRGEGARSWAGEQTHARTKHGNSGGEGTQVRGMTILGRGKLGQRGQGVWLSGARVRVPGEGSLPARNRSLEQEQPPGRRQDGELRVLRGAGGKGHIQVLGQSVLSNTTPHVFPPLW